VNNSSDANRAEIIEQALKSENWNDFLFAHIEMDRPSALKIIANRLTDTEYWKLIRLIWTHADEIWRNEDLWRELLTRQRPNRHEIMEEKERQELSGLNDPVLIYRGHTEFNPDGWSWTLSWSRAKEFAKTTNGWPDKGTPVVTQAKVLRSNVIAYLILVDEEEILIDPTDAFEHETVEVNHGE